MYPCSDAFHQAVKDRKPQKALLIFSDCVFTNDDISVDVGIGFNDYFSVEKDIAIGQTPSNEITFTLFNDKRKLNDYEFGDFLATCGVLIGVDRYIHYGTAMVKTAKATYIGSGEYPYISRNGVALSAQPSFGVMSIVAYDGKVWCFGNGGKHAVYNDSTGQNITSANPLNDFMKEKCAIWSGKGIFYNKDSRILFIYENGNRQRYEFVPFGWFTAERPNAPDVIQIDMTCNDFMQKFEKDMPSASELGVSLPVTFGTLLDKMCKYVGVQCESTTFTNSEARLKKWPDDFSSSTMRDVLKWIAEAAGSIARFNRDGQLKMDWIKTTSQVYGATEYSEFNPYYYKTKQITKLINRSTQKEGDKTLGDGEEEYLIQDNPLLRGVS